MKTIVQALKQENLMVVDQSYKSDYLYYSNIDKLWHVFRQGKLIASPKDQKIAVDFLLGKRT